MIKCSITAWTNLIVMLISSTAFSYLYIRSVGPAALEKKIGKEAYRKCSRYRMAAAILEMAVVACYIIYFFFPLPIALDRYFPWSWWISAVIAVVMAVPAGYLFGRGVKDAGEESMVPKKEHALYGGIYRKIRHPQTVGELLLWWVIAFFLNSPFLAFFSLIWIPVFYLFCLEEEKDLAIRYGRQYIEYRKNTGFIIPKRDKSG